MAETSDALQAATAAKEVLAWLAAALCHRPGDDRWPGILDGLDAAVDAAAHVTASRDVELRAAAAELVRVHRISRAQREAEGMYGFSVRLSAVERARELLADRFLTSAASMARVRGWPARGLEEMREDAA